MALGVWGTRWIGELGDKDLDPHLLMWDMKRTVPVQEWPRTRTVLSIRFDDVLARIGSWWLVTTEGQVDVCDFDPGFEMTATVRPSLRALTEIWCGDRSWEQAIGEGSLVVEAPSEVRRALPRWVGQGQFAAVAR